MIGRLEIECLVGLLQKGGTIIAVSDSNFGIFHQSLTWLALYSHILLWLVGGGFVKVVAYALVKEYFLIVSRQYVQDSAHWRAFIMKHWLNAGSDCLAIIQTKGSRLSLLRSSAAILITLQTRRKLSNHILLVGNWTFKQSSRMNRGL